MPPEEPTTGEVEAIELSFPHHPPATIWSFWYFLFIFPLYISIMYFLIIVALEIPCFWYYILGLLVLLVLHFVLTWIKVIQIYHFFITLSIILFYFLYSYLLLFLKHVVSPILLEIDITQEVPLPPYNLKRSCHIEDNVQLGWGESWGRKFFVIYAKLFW